MKNIVQLFSIVVLMCASIPQAMAGITFTVGDGSPINLFKDTGNQLIPVYISSNASDSLTGVDIFFAGVGPGATTFAPIGQVNQPGMFGNASFSGGSFGQFSPGFSNLLLNYSAPVSVDASNSLIANIVIDTNALDFGNYAISNAGGGQVLNGVSEVAFSTNGANFSITAVPEPSSLALLGVVGLSGVAYRRFRNRKLAAK
ncbi:PEP-CTERM sorting domain-containing protein [Pirellulaceae bacterium SH501]